MLNPPEVVIELFYGNFPKKGKIFPPERRELPTEYEFAVIPLYGSGCIHSVLLKT